MNRRHPLSKTADDFAAEHPDDHLAAVDARLIDHHPTVPAEEIRRLRREESSRLAGSRITSFAAILVERATRRRLAGGL